MTVDDWFQPLPIQEYQQLNQHCGENVPSELPVADFIGGLDIRCGPILKLAGCLENNSDNWRGTLLLVIKVKEGEAVEPKVDYKIGPANEGGDAVGGVGDGVANGVANGGGAGGADGTTNTNSNVEFKTGAFPGTLIETIKDYQFWRFNISLQLTHYEQKIKYFINGHYKQSFQFFVPAANQSMNVISYSCNGFSLGADATEYKSSLWYDVLKKHAHQHYHVMLGGGDQIYSDAIKMHSKQLEQWMSERNPIKKYQMKPDDQAVQEFNDFYLNNYLAWFGKGYWTGKSSKTYQLVLPLAMAQIPSVNIYDDHDIIDGFGSYHDTTMRLPFFSAVGNIAYKYYMLFQHHVSPSEKIHDSLEADPSWILSGSAGPFIKQKNHSNYLRLGREISLLGLDCRTERKLKEIIRPDTYSRVFKRLETEIAHAPEVKHLLVMLGVPILYPRMVWLEWILNSPVLKPIKSLAAKGIISKGLVNEFDGSVEVLDDLNDHWCSKHHKRERNYLVKKLIDFGAAHGVRITILSGDVHLCCVGRIKSKIQDHPGFHVSNWTGQEVEKIDILAHPETDPRLMFNVTSSAIVNAPPPDAMAKMLNSRSKIHHFDRHTEEDIVPFFTRDPNGDKRENHQFLNKRNWADLIIAKQSIHKDKLGENIAKFPSSLFKDDQKDWERHTVNKRDNKYPLLPDSLVTTLHVEDDPNDFEAKTASYEILIPKLDGTYELDKTKVKHLS